jgi:hypothetical protein
MEHKLNSGLMVVLPINFGTLRDMEMAHIPSRADLVANTLMLLVPAIKMELVFINGMALVLEIKNGFSKEFK